MTKIFGFWCSIFFYSVVFAKEQAWIFDSARVNGRGRTYVAATDSDEATRFNPATLAETNIRYQLRFLQLDGFVGNNVIESINDITSIFANSSVDGTDILKKFSSKFGKRQYFKLQGSFLAQRFGRHELAPFITQTGALELENPALPEMSWNSDTIAGGSWTSAFTVLTNLELGVTLRPFYRWHISSDIAFTDLTSFLSSNVDISTIAPMSGGFGLGTDVGFIYKLDPTLRLGLTVQNLGDTGYFQKSKNVPPPIKQTVNAGIMKKTVLSSRSSLDTFIDYHDILNRKGLNLLRLINAGVELGSSIFSRDHDFGLVSGINEGWFCYGFFADILFLRADFSSYAVELGHSPGQIEERIWALSIRSAMTF